ncbi:hypothetical protein EGW08_013370, partial [Elysia chlorotica]
HIPAVIWYTSAIFGFPGNILILILANRMKLTPSLLYLIFLAIFDLCCLFVPCIIIFYFQLLLPLGIPFEVVFVFSFTCKICSNWLLAFLSLERCIAVCFPIRKKI